MTRVKERWRNVLEHFVVASSETKEKREITKNKVAHLFFQKTWTHTKTHTTVTTTEVRTNTHSQKQTDQYSRDNDFQPSSLDWRQPCCLKYGRLRLGERKFLFIFSCIVNSFKLTLLHQQTIRRNKQNVNKQCQIVVVVSHTITSSLSVLHF